MAIRNSRESFKVSEIFRRFYEAGNSGGIILLACAILSLVLANSAIGREYCAFWDKEVGFQTEHIHLRHSILGWINDGLMTLFFLLVGLEIERELLVGELSSRKKAMLPVAAAIGGMVVPAFIYFIVNLGNLGYKSGAGIPTATDIAFAIAILGLLGKRIPNTLRVSLVALAIMDDLGAIVVIAVFYGQGISWLYLVFTLLLFGVLLLCRWAGKQSLWIYIPSGLVLWFLMLHSGIHPTLSGVLLAFAIPFNKVEENSSSYRLERMLQKPVHWFVVPLFAMANTALLIGNDLWQGQTIFVGFGIVLGLLLGKPLGIYLGSRLAIFLGWAEMPDDVSNKMLWGAGILGGIGFTVAMFVANLAFTDPSVVAASKLFVLMASGCAALLGGLWLRWAAARA